MDLEIKLEVFEGPLDLLLHLIDKNKVNIYDIPIVEITAQYLDYVRQMDKEDLDLVSEFLVMAATLLDIKSKMLLPKEVDESGEEEDPRAELVERLLEYRKFKYMSGELRDRGFGSERLQFKEPTVPKEVACYKPPVDLDELLKDVTMLRLKAIFDETLRRQADKVDTVRSQFGKIERETIQIGDKISDVRRKVARGGRYSFRQLLHAGATKVEIVVTFLAVLEMIKIGEIRLTEDSTRDDIIIEGNG
ncbi:segregation/condensation protein A [Cuneatibacter sp. NSJ-177]|jgi:segregation and condensation protein A|uniref:segregation and condensation protein A n=1 Tax=Cuneatibacter sp. NSJ-177 TaxID=2931401 RepID=UPI001FD004B7|nr:segregation/condensation protein A [Cuneatibacter sp. NSJ-177]MCJ7835918.1 segregation/condensation protein A [Cuneatibacter sp. NSJ-177]